MVVTLILVVSCALLFLMTGSVLVPLKAAVLNALSLPVMFGALVWIFQDGNLSGTLGFNATTAAATTPARSPPGSSGAAR